MLFTIIKWIVIFVVFFFVSIILSMMQTKIELIRNRKKIKIEEENLTARYIKNHPWRRLSDFDEKDDHRERLTSPKISALLKKKAKEVIEPYLISQGFYPCKKNRLLYRKIKNDIVFEICIEAIHKSQRGRRSLEGYFYPLCLVHSNYDETLDDPEYDYYHYILVKDKGEIKLPFCFDCAIEENLIHAVSDMKDLIEDRILPFFDRYDTLQSMEDMYITSYKKSDITDIKKYTYLFRNAIFYIGEGKYQEAKKELELLYQNKQMYLNRNRKRLTYYESFALDCNKELSYESDIRYYKSRLNLYEKHIKMVEMLLELIDDTSKISQWHSEQIEVANIILKEAELYGCYVL